ncbi:DUF4258 domain-containing protein [Novosphingobium sp. PY1]|uniref:DUF4258 domain-containing protein n=1 Tax=Novosphingobium sp. PY1 TaxID=1882221 RepID=UPI001A8D8F28|nr:DUF4258 domain-containing protein [Novosphingobium sp. PY1]GFM28603.1 uncharacterized protein PY1_contig-04-651 [Novosphingobium sp. PY1]
MSDLGISSHAEKRMSQRAIREADIDLILQLGTEVEGGVLVRQKDFEDFERRLRHQLSRARRLVGKRLVLGGDHLVTAYHASRSDTKRLLRD